MTESERKLLAECARLRAALEAILALNDGYGGRYAAEYWHEAETIARDALAGEAKPAPPLPETEEPG